MSVLGPATWTCEDCGGEFSAINSERDRLCGNCSATTDLPRCGATPQFAVSTADHHVHCQRPAGHMGHHTYGRKRS